MSFGVVLDTGVDDKAYVSGKSRRFLSSPLQPDWKPSGLLSSGTCGSLVGSKTASARS
jgi:hypothetical protein